MKLFNTQSQSLEEFTSPDGKVGIYVCGVTPYDTTHLGHAFTFLTYDVLVRYLRFQGYTVTYVQNVTDIDDDILRKAGELGMDWQELAQRETELYLGDMRSLNAVDFDHFTAATEHIPQVVQNVQELMNAGVAYEVNGSVYFSIEKDPEFGKLSRLPLSDMLPIANERGNKPDDPNKQDPLDFLLWQAGVPGEPTWDSPWGPGRPGWHIECTSMSRHYLGDQFDIHGGGYDLIFPHHEAEIAQAESVTGAKPFVRYWMHVAMVDYQGEKMSKSLGNLVYVRDLIKTYSADAIRLSLLRHHYREPWEFFDDDMPVCQEIAASLRQAAHAEGSAGESLDPTAFRQAFLAALDNDLDTGAAVDALRDLATAITQASGEDTSAATKTLRDLGDVLGISLS
jgi:L-cysteine:1D-myo-inositol 2-amino-2-deoxy-alpha-D-glucopyranoside ligase